MKQYKTIWIKGKQKRLHRYLMEKHLERDLLPSELVHHINNDKFDNRIDNLEIISRGSHLKTHHIGIKTRFKKQFSFDRNYLIKLRKEGLSMQKIANKLKCSQPTIFRALKEYDIK